ncbi:hypothetical protein ABVT39_002571 [Epinephelus coioides]
MAAFNYIRGNERQICPPCRCHLQFNEPTRPSEALQHCKTALYGLNDAEWLYARQEDRGQQKGRIEKREVEYVDRDVHEDSRVKYIKKSTIPSEVVCLVVQQRALLNFSKSWTC